MDLRRQWFEEYSRKGIPSSFRDEPAGSVTHFHEFLKKQGIVSGKLLDLGCGRGRHSFYFAKNGFEVSSIDFVPELIDEVNSAASQERLKVNAICQSVTNALPFERDYFDVAIDVFCYKHQASKEKQTFYRSELHRVLKGGGYYLLTLAGDDDGFYGPLLKDSSEPENKLIVDPVTKVSSFLYSRQDVENEFSQFFEIVDFVHKKKRGLMHGREYERSTLLFIMRKRV